MACLSWTFYNRNLYLWGKVDMQKRIVTLATGQRITDND